MATARAALHSRQLRFVQPDGANTALTLVVDRREQLVATRVQAVGRLHRLIRELIPGGAERELTAEKAFVLVSDLEPDDEAGEMRVEMSLEHIDDIRALDRKIDQATARINEIAKDSKTTLSRIYGIGPLNAALILGEVGNVGRFQTRNHFASSADMHGSPARSCSPAGGGPNSVATNRPPRSRASFETPLHSGVEVSEYLVGSPAFKAQPGSAVEN